MTDNEYFDDHIPHRLNLLIAFRTRYSDGHQSRASLNSETYRDLFRCTKDMCFLMTRFFLGELGLYFDEKTQHIEDAQKWTPRFNRTRAPLSLIRSDLRYTVLCKMYQTANDAVAHLNEFRAYHFFETSKEEQQMIPVIDWIEELISRHIYQAAGRDLERSMKLPNNDMNV